MKKKLQLLAMLCTCISYSQWNLIGHLPIAETATQQMNYIKFYDENIGYADLAGIGSSGWFHVQVKTVDGGLNWTQTALPTTFSSKPPVFIGDADHFILAGASNGMDTSYRTSDGGATFVEIPSLNSFFGDFYFKDNLKGFYVISTYLLSNNLRTTSDGGVTWSSGQSTNPPLYEMYFPDTSANTGYVVTGNSALKTVDNGSTWLADPSINIPNIGGRVKFTSPQIWYKGNSTNSMYKTINGGASWLQVAAFSGYEYEFTDTQTGFVRKVPINNVWPDHTNSVYRTIDGGASWQPFGQFEPFAQYDQIFDFSFPTTQVGYAVTTSGILYKCENILSSSKKQPSKFGLYPNPVNDELFLEGTFFNSEPFFIYDVTGRNILSGIISANRIDVSALTDGYYFLKVDGYNSAKFKKQ